MYSHGLRVDADMLYTDGSSTAAACMGHCNCAWCLYNPHRTCPEVQAPQATEANEVDLASGSMITTSFVHVATYLR